MNKYRNIFVVALCAVGGGWLGLWLNSVTGNTQPPMESLGVLVWLALPALAGLALRAFGGDGWKDAGLGLNLRAGWQWYVVALVVYPLAALVSLAAALATRAITADGFAAQGLGAYISAVGFFLGASLMKNVFEELAWRGYLTARLNAANVHPMLNHFIVSVVWWAWHLPYYFYFLDRAQLQAATPYGLPVFLLIALIGLFPTAVLFGELRLHSQSVWPVFILHNSINALSMPLMLNGFIASNGWLSLLVSPTNDGLLTALLLGAAGWWLYQQRMKNLPNR